MAEDEADVVLAFRAYAQMHAAGGVPGTISPLKMLTTLLRFMRGPDSVLLLAMEGDLVAGVLALAKCGYWFSEDSFFLEDKGLFILPDHRGGGALKALLETAKQTSDDTGLPVFITINNGQRQRGAGSKWERVGATLGYHNRGATLAHFPEKS